MVIAAPSAILGNDLSIASTQSAPTAVSQQTVITAADLTGPGPDPTSAMQAFTATNNVKGLQYPSDLPMAYMTLIISKYSRQNWNSIGQLGVLASVVLPLPMQLVDRQEVLYDIESLNFAQQAAIAPISAALANNQGIVASAGAGVEALGGAASALVGGGLGAAASVSGIAGALAAAGVSVNQFMTVMLKGPVYKNWTFQWKFSPRSPEESQSLYDIKNLLNNASAPSLYQNFGSAFFRWPCIISPSFNYARVTGAVSAGNLGMQTFLMKKSVIRDIQWNYTPAGKPSFYSGTSGSPESIELTMTLLALEFFLSDSSGAGITGDYGSNPQDGGVSVSNTSNLAIPWAALVTKVANSLINSTGTNNGTFNGQAIL